MASLRLRTCATRRRRSARNAVIDQSRLQRARKKVLVASIKTSVVFLATPTTLKFAFGGTFLPSACPAFLSSLPPLYFGRNPDASICTSGLLYYFVPTRLHSLKPAFSTAAFGHAAFSTSGYDGSVVAQQFRCTSTVLHTRVLSFPFSPPAPGLLSNFVSSEASNPIDRIARALTSINYYSAGFSF